MGEANPVRIPMSTGGDILVEGQQLPEEIFLTYQEIVGALLYLSTCTRPDISFAAGCPSRHVAKPTTVHLTAAKKVFRYLKGTSTLSLTDGQAGRLMGYSDADSAGDLETRRSTTGFMLTLNGAAVCWGSKSQATVSHSTTEEEYVAASVAAKEAIWRQRLLLDIPGDGAPVHMRCDSQRALAMMHNEVSSNPTKHIDVAYNFVREMVGDGRLVAEHVPSKEMTADALTKALPTTAFNNCRKGAGLHPTLWNDNAHMEV